MIEILRQLDNYRQFVFLQQLTQSLLATKAGWNITVEIKNISSLTKTGAFHVHKYRNKGLASHC